MKLLKIGSILLMSLSAFAQEYKADISICQFSAEFTKSAEINLSNYKQHNTHLFYIEKDNVIFEKEKIIYLPTLILFQNGKEIMRVESGISMKYPENTKKELENKLEELLENKF
jgi:hypothetical protein